MATDERDELRDTILVVLRPHAAPKIVDGSTVLSLDNVGPYKLAGELCEAVGKALGERDAEIAKLKKWKAGYERLDKGSRELIQKLQAELAALKAVGGMNKDVEN